MINDPTILTPLFIITYAIRRNVRQAKCPSNKTK